MSNLIDAKLEQHRISGSKQCPSCGHKLDQKQDWVGLPAGVKFDPTDQELIEHLESKVSEEELRSHPLIDEFIPTIGGEDGICYTHPEKLPGVTKDGRSKHFFHRPSKAYTTGTRKRRKIQTERDLQRGETRWHKTGKTRPVLVNGKQKGCKKILVLYTNFGKHRKPEKTNWVMHQYHLGELEEEKDGKLVVSKIFYQTQPRQCSWSADYVSRRDSGSCSSSKEVLSQIEIEAGNLEKLSQMKTSDDISFGTFRKSFDEADATAKMHNEEHEKQGHYHLNNEQQRAQAAAAVRFHIARPSNPISTILSPASLHQRPLVLDDPFHVSSILLHHDKFQQQRQQQQHQHQQPLPPCHKLVERSSTGLEELIMGRTSATNRGEESIQQPHETEWLKYSYWSSDNPNHRG